MTVAESHQIRLSQDTIDHPDGGQVIWCNVEPYPYPEMQHFSDAALDIEAIGSISWTDPEGARWVMLGSPPVVLYRIVGRDGDGRNIAVKHQTFLARKVLL